MSAAVARLLIARGIPRAVWWMSAAASSEKSGSDRPATATWWPMWATVSFGPFIKPDGPSRNAPHHAPQTRTFEHGPAAARSVNESAGICNHYLSAGPVTGLLRLPTSRVGLALVLDHRHSEGNKLPSAGQLARHREPPPPRR
jgi:hypothetical protein